jgi:hypothetical protein
MDNLQSALQGWKKYLADFFGTFLVNMSLKPYRGVFKGCGERKENIAVALCFWSFVMNKIPAQWQSARQEFLSVFVKSDNHYVKIVAMVELLPTSVWRKLLWKNNIDFSSFEAFLRRLTTTQLMAIETCYNEFTSGKIVSIRKVRKVPKKDYFRRITVRNS